MSKVIANVDQIKYTGAGEVRREVSKPKHFTKKILGLLSVDADGFCESKDWPYLWPGQHKENRK